MSINTTKNNSGDVDLRPAIIEFKNSREFFIAQLNYLKKTERHFSIPQQCKNLRKVSPTLVTLIAANKRRITLDRSDEIALLLKLNVNEKTYFKKLILHEEFQNESSTTDKLKDNFDSIENFKESFLNKKSKERKQLAENILNQPLNLYVKDAFQIPQVQKDIHSLFQQLSFIGNSKNIKKSLNFLLKEGYLRKTLEKKIVIDTPLSVAEPENPSEKIKKIHKKGLKIAYKAIDLVPTHSRIANTFIVPLSKESYEEIQDLIAQFTQQLKDFAESKALSGNQLYQLAVHLSPTGVVPLTRQKPSQKPDSNKKKGVHVP